MQQYFQPKISRKIRIFSLGQKNNILTKKRVHVDKVKFPNEENSTPG